MSRRGGAGALVPTFVGQGNPPLRPTATLDTFAREREWPEGELRPQRRFRCGDPGHPRGCAGAAGARC
jgi:hypothetical protein